MLGYLFCCLIVGLDRFVFLSHIDDNKHFIKDYLLEKHKYAYTLTQAFLAISALVTATLFWQHEKQTEIMPYIGVMVYGTTRFIIATHFFQFRVMLEDKYIGMASAPLKLKTVFVTEVLINVGLYLLLM